MSSSTRSSRKRRTTRSTTSSSICGDTSVVSQRGHTPRRNTKRSKKSFTIFCEGCDTNFVGKFANTRQFIKEHAELNETCCSHLHQCKCCKMHFFNFSDKTKHLEQNSRCRKFNIESRRHHRFKESHVPISSYNDSNANSLKKEEPLHKLNPFEAFEKNIRQQLWMSLEQHSIALAKQSAKAVVAQQEKLLDNATKSSGASSIYPTKPTDQNSSKLTSNSLLSDGKVSSIAPIAKVGDRQLRSTTQQGLNNSLTQENNLSEHFHSSSDIQFTLNDDENESSHSQSSTQNNDNEDHVQQQHEQHQQHAIVNIDQEEEEYEEDMLNRIEEEDEMSQQNEDEENFVAEVVDLTNVENIVHQNTNHAIAVEDNLQLSPDHFIKMKKDHHENLSSLKTDKEYNESLLLIQEILSRDQSLNSWYNEMMKWRYPNGKRGEDYISLNKVNEHVLSRVYGSIAGEIMRPKVTSIEVPSGRIFNVVTFGIDAMIYELLDDIDLTSCKNLIFNKGDVNDPFKFDGSEYYGDFESSEYYINTVKKYEDEKQRRETSESESDDDTSMIDQEYSKEVIVPLIIYIDETTIDVYSKLQLHPVCMSFMIYNRETRNMERAWRTIGYIPTVQSILGVESLTVEAKLDDFHFILGFILRRIKTIQNQKNGFKWNFRFRKYKNRIYKRTLRFPIGYFSGDGKGNHTLCCKYQSRGFMKYLCRECNVTLDESDDPNFVCKFHKMKDLGAMTKDELNKISFHYIPSGNAMAGMDFGANPYGLNGATPPDPCHQLNKGVVQRLPDILQARLSKNMVKVLNNHVSYISCKFSNQSNNSIPSFNPFKNGLAEVSKLNANEQIAKVLIVYLTLLTSEFEASIINKKGRKPNKDSPAETLFQIEYNNWVVAFEEVLIFCAWVYLKKHPKVFFKGGTNSLVHQRIKQYMEVLKNNAQRKKGKGWKIDKFHQVLHYNLVVRLWACLSNVDTARSEGHHKKKKSIAKTTQRKGRVLDIQTANNEFWFNAYLKAMKIAGIEIKKKFETFVCGDDEEDATSSNTTSATQSNNVDQTREEDDDNDDGEDDIEEESEIEEETDDELDKEEMKKNLHNMKGSRFVVTFDYIHDKVSAKWLGRKLKKREFEIPQHILDTIHKKLKGYNHGVEKRRLVQFTCFTEWKGCDSVDDKETNIFRACPKYRNEGHWFDWAMINWGKKIGVLPAQLLLLISKHSMKFEYDPESTEKAHKKLKGKNAYALIHSTTAESFNYRKCAPIRKKSGVEVPSTEEGPLTRISEFYDMEDFYQLIDIETIDSSAFVIVNKSGVVLDDNDNVITDLIPGNAKHIIYLQPMSTWHKYFLDYESKDLIELAKEKVNDSITENDERYPYEG